MNLIDTLSVLLIGILALALFIKKLMDSGRKNDCGCSSKCSQKFDPRK